ncbi:hypothetical protein COU89_02125 [Candidatus Roizmanbacteria bacterium CG10_big_fil_rev_8_21_14_0_10_45_7]|uniref:Uncharacterized protein n=1 Tax=Candidatus Roizmanbacteria bacterium CG10_big_fil_rev_8_21_14_0_10_45_7 TaxID=1974854 RepID=A0A2M8KUS1_9BACT|nr:MAG: hypothetical protein COU89_02125 [Candidatus Roizmanbacteria bacterium CG10_big_fil_rev_8_21_14_0_10_45_7]
MIQDLKKYLNLKTPLFQFFLFLSLFGIFATLDLLIATVNPIERNQYLMNAVVVLMTGCVVYYLIRYGFGVKGANPLNFFISTWIVYLLVHPTNSIWYFITGVIAIGVGKYWFRRSNLPVFNPAALALTITYGVSVVASWFNPSARPLLVSWWGVDMTQNMTNAIPVLNMVAPALFLVVFMRYAGAFKRFRYALIFFVTFLASMFIYTYLHESLNSALSLTYANVFNATAFCAFVMLAEPKTSPIFPWQHVVIGIISGLALFTFYTILGAWLVDPLLTVVLFANIVTLLTKIRHVTTVPLAKNPQK